jgi:PKD repeat protein
MFTAVLTDPLPLGTYSATLKVSNNADEGTQEVLALMHIIDQVITPTADFVSNSPICLGDTAVFTFTGDPGVPAGDFLWHFGDGMTSTLMHPTHVYATEGSYTVTLEVCNLGGCDTASDLFEVLPTPTAGFTYAVADLTVTFTNSSSAADTYLWDFGDGMTSTLEHPIYTYPAAGSYTVTLYAWGPCGADMFVDVLTVGIAPTAGFLHNAPLCLGEMVVFTNTSTGTLPLDYMWWFGDGMTSTLEHPTYTYAAAGSYTVTLEASNDFGMDTVMDSVEVLDVPMADFTYIMDGLVVTFTNSSMYATDYLWDFGDGSTSTMTHPVHTYAMAGSYTVTLQATGICGMDTMEMAVTVEEGMYYLYLPLITKNYGP